MSRSVFANNRIKNVLVLGQGITQGLDDTTLTAEKSIQSILLQLGSLHYNGDNSYLFVNGIDIIKFKGKYSENPLCLGNTSKGFSEDNMKKTGLYGTVFGVSVDHKVIAVDDILDIHKYLIKKDGI